MRITQPRYRFELIPSDSGEAARVLLHDGEYQASFDERGLVGQINNVKENRRVSQRTALSRHPRHARSGIAIFERGTIMIAQTTQELVSNIPLEKIIYNRYQMRSQMSQTELEDLAKNIHENGIMQKPTARYIAKGDVYELAFGHRRFEAYKALAARDTAYRTMPLLVRELSDQQMFDLAWDENHEREDINPIDEGAAYETYMREFEKTSKEAGERFGVSEETIRAKIRLGNLPEPAKEKVRKGKLNESAARALLTLARVLPDDDKALNEAMQEIEQGEKPEKAVDAELRSSERTVIIHSSQFPTKQKSFKYLPKLTLNEAKQVLDLKSESVIWDGAIEALYKGDKQTHGEYFANEPESLKKLEQMAHLIKPPACTACPYFAQVNGLHWCGWKPCHERKTAAEKLASLHQFSEKTGVAIWTEADGKSVELNKYNDKHKAYWEKRGPDLRLELVDNRHYFNAFEDIPNHAIAVVIGKTYETWKKAETKSRAKGSEQTEYVDHLRQQAINNIVEAQTELFVWEAVTPHFASLLGEIKQVDFLETLLDNTDYYPSNVLPQYKERELNAMKRGERLTLARRKILFHLIFRDGLPGNLEKSKTPAAVFAKHIRNLAIKWSLRLPKDFEKQAETYDQAIRLEIEKLDGKAAK